MSTIIKPPWCEVSVFQMDFRSDPDKKSLNLSLLALSKKSAVTFLQKISALVLLTEHCHAQLCPWSMGNLLILHMQFLWQHLLDFVKYTNFWNYWRCISYSSFEDIDGFASVALMRASLILCFLIHRKFTSGCLVWKQEWGRSPHLLLE